jgi:hypothetical protein
MGIPSSTGENPILINHPVGQQVPSGVAGARCYGFSAETKTARNVAATLGSSGSGRPTWVR